MINQNDTPKTIQSKKSVKNITKKTIGEKIIKAEEAKKTPDKKKKK